MKSATRTAPPPTKLRFTGTAIETVEAAVLARNVERNEVLKSSDVVVERRPKAEVGADAAARDRAVGMQARRQLRAGQAIRTADLAKPDLVQRDQNVTLIYEAPGHLSHHARQGAGERHRRRRRQRHEPAVEAHGVRHRDRPRPGLDQPGRPRRRPPQTSDATSSLGSTATPRPSPSPPSVRQSLQKPSNVNVSHPVSTASSSPAPCCRWPPLASGCSSIDRLSQIGEKPKLTEIENPTTQPGYKPVQMPMPKPEQASYNANSLWRNGSRAFFKDQRAARIGDLLTVTVNITDKANIANETQRSRTSKEDSGITDFIGSPDDHAGRTRSCPAAS